jgi:nucleoside diphosphate kinase
MTDIDALLERDMAKPVSDIEIPRGLTAVELKRAFFSIDNYFREAWWDLAPIRSYLERLAVVVFKPDAVVGRRIEPCLHLLHQHGYRILSGHIFHYSRHAIRETWRYQFNIASRERIEVVDRLLTATPSLLIVIGDDEAQELPASIRLGALKGPSDPSLRRPGEIRHELGVLTTLFNFIHTSDEPLDVVREIGVALDGPYRRALAADVGSWIDSSEYVLGLTRQLDAAHPAHDLGRDEALDRLRHHNDDTIRESVQQIRKGDVGAWRKIFSAIPRVDIWDALSIATACIECNVPGLTAVLPSIAGDSGIRAWQDLDAG